MSLFRATRLIASTQCNLAKRTFTHGTHTFIKPHLPDISVPEHLLEGYDLSSLTALPVTWGDHDEFRHVNNLVYIGWFQEARVRFLKHLLSKDLPKLYSDFMSGRHIGPILKSVSCKYKSPVSYPDTVVIGTRISSIGKDRFSFLHRIVSQKQQKIVAEGSDTLVVINYQTGEKAEIPSNIRQYLEKSFSASQQAHPLPHHPHPHQPSHSGQPTSH